MIKYANNHRRDVSFQVGDTVFLNLRLHQQQSVCKRIYQKLVARCYGPFRIIKRIGNVAYKLQLLLESRVHPFFHVSCLKKTLGNKPQDEAKLPEELETDLAIKYEPEGIWAKRFKKRETEQILQLLVQWKGRRAEETTWEDADVFLSPFSDHHLEDKVVFEGGDNDTGTENVGLNKQRPMIQYVYSKKKIGKPRGGGEK